MTDMIFTNELFFYDDVYCRTSTFVLINNYSTSNITVTILQLLKRKQFRENIRHCVCLTIVPNRIIFPIVLHELRTRDLTSSLCKRLRDLSNYVHRSIVQDWKP